MANIRFTWDSKKAARKDLVSMRLDRDVLAWLRSKGVGYQTRMNAILREAMAKDLKRTS